MELLQRALNQKSRAHACRLGVPANLPVWVFQVGGTSRAFQQAVRALIEKDGFHPRLVVGCSGNHGLVEVDVGLGDVLQHPSNVLLDCLLHTGPSTSSHNILKCLASDRQVCLLGCW